jgi:hypothetical protein
MNSIINVYHFADEPITIDIYQIKDESIVYIDETNITKRLDYFTTIKGNFIKEMAYDKDVFELNVLLHILGCIDNEIDVINSQIENLQSKKDIKTVLTKDFGVINVIKLQISKTTNLLNLQMSMNKIKDLFTYPENN